MTKTQAEKDLLGHLASKIRCQNAYVGKRAEIDILEMALALEETTGKNIITIYDLPAEQKQDWDTDQQAVKQERIDAEANRLAKIQSIQVDIDYLDTKIGVEPDNNIKQELLKQKQTKEAYKLKLENTSIPQYTPKPKPSWIP